jgi:hypothetical protein
MTKEDASALHYAAMWNYEDIAEIIYDHGGFDINLKNKVCLFNHVHY